MNWLLVLSIAGAVGTVFSVIQVVRDGWDREGKKSAKVKALVYPIIIVILTSVSVYVATLNQELTEIQQQARLLRDEWPGSVETLSSQPRGANLGIVNGGLAFIEQYKKKLPVSVGQAKELAVEARRVCILPDEYAACATAAGGMMGLIDAIGRGAEESVP